MRIFKTISLMMLLLWVTSCAPDDRCGNDFNYIDGACVPIEDTETSTDPPEDSGPVDAGDGLGEICTTDGNECAGFDADYCLLQPGADEGYCTYEDCTTDPDNCSAGYSCCMMASSSSFCATDEDYQTMADLGLCVS